MQSTHSNVQCSYSGEIMYDPRKILKVYVGIRDRNLKNLDFKKFEYLVDKVILHNKWDGSGASFPDLALLKLIQTVTFVTDFWKRLVFYIHYVPLALINYGRLQYGKGESELAQK